MPQPVVDETMVPVFHCRLDATTTVVAANDDVLDLEYFHRELDYRKAIQVRVNYNVGNVSVNENFAWLEIDDLIGRNAAVGAADPQVLGGLLLGELGKKARVFPSDGICPFKVLVQKVL